MGRAREIDCPKIGVGIEELNKLYAVVIRGFIPDFMHVFMW